MARPQNRKRQRADELPQDNPPAKRAKLTSGRNFPPSFWDNLSKVWLTPRALRELDRRNNTRPSPSFTAPRVTDLARFARHGGPDLRHLRGCPEPKGATHKMSTGRSSTSRSRRTQSTEATTVATGSGKSSAYGKEFQQHLADHGVYMNNRQSKLGNPQELQSKLLRERASLSPSQFSEGAFENFQRENEDTVFESDVMAKVVPVICGNASIPNKQNVLFTELDPITNKGAVKPKPDFFDGTDLQELSREVREDQDLRSKIIPTKHPSVPVAPNFFLEVKGPDGSLAVAQRQACYDGAYGARAMHALQNYGAEEPQYDGKAHTFSSIYHGGQLQLYAHHVTAPMTEGERPEYHMTQLKAYALTSDHETCVKGLRAFRNARDLAGQHRDNFIEAANARASQPRTTVADQERTTADIQPPEDSADELAPSSPHYTTQLQYKEDSPDELALTPPGYLYEGDDSQDPPGIDPPTSLTTSFTSSFSHQGRSKRQRSPRSDAAEGHTSKIRSRSTREAESSASATGPALAGAAESFQVRTYWKKGKLCFLNLRGQEVKTEGRDWMEQVLDDGGKRFYWQSPKSGRVFWITTLPRELRIFSSTAKSSAAN